MDYDSDSELRATDTLRFDSESEDELQPTIQEFSAERETKIANIVDVVETATIESNKFDSESKPKAEIRNRRKKVSTIIDSDSENDCVQGSAAVPTEMLVDNTNKATMNRLKSLLDSDSDSNEQSATNTFMRSKKLTKKRNTSSSAVVSDTEDDTTIGSVKAKRKQQSGTKKASSPVKTAKDMLAGLNLFLGDDDDDDEASQKEPPDTDNCNSDDESVGDSVKQMKPIQKMTAKQAMEDKQVIQSESQRMAREAFIDVPYHRTKSYTFEEFLARKTIRKANDPSRDCLGKSTNMSIKMTPEQLEAFAMQMKERELESQEFFKSSDEEPENDTAEHEEPITNTEPGAVDHSNLTTTCVGQSENIQEQISQQCTLGIDLTTAPTTEHEDDHIDDLVNRTSENMETLMSYLHEKEPSTLQTPNDTGITYDLISEVAGDTTMSTKKVSLIEKLNLSSCPRLSGSSDMMIDLDSGNMQPKEPTGADILFQRLAKCSGSARKSASSKTTVSILSTDDGVVKLSTVSLFAETERPLVHKEPTPGAAFLQLKQALKEKIDHDRRATMRKREEEFAKKMAMEKAEIGYETDEEGEEKMVDEECEDSDNENGTAAAGQRMKFLNHEATKDADVDDKEEENGDNESSENNSSTDEDDEIKTCENVNKKGRIIKAFEDSDDEEVPVQPQDFIPAIPTDANAFNDEIITNKMSCIYNEVNEENVTLLWKDDNTEEPQDDDLMGLCSGRFATQLPSENTQTLTQQMDNAHDGHKNNEDKQERQSTTTHLYTQTEQPIHDSQLMELCSGRFETQLPVPEEKTTQMDIDLKENSVQAENEKTLDNSDILAGERLCLNSSDDETEHEGNVVAMWGKKRRRKHLHLSDDEDDTDREPSASETVQENSDGDGECDEEKAMEEENVAEETERYVDYDSEENEVEVTLSKKKKKLMIANFVENEAELSESEWGSADEDEKGLDRYDIELADEEQFDQHQLQQELEKIHNRQMLDQDNREIEHLKEHFLEDEENNGVGRVRQFRWKNVEKTFSLDYDKQKEGEENVEERGNGDASDEETELEWRKLRHERNMMLKEQNVDPNETELSEPTLPNPDTTAVVTDGEENNLSVCNISIAGKRKITIVKKTSSANTAKEDNPFLISNSNNVQGHKASFLTRDPETLHKLANLVKCNPETEGSSTVMAAKGRNFVFAALSPAIEKASKRSLDPEDVEEKRNLKKAKTTSRETSSKKKLLDSLL